MQKRYRTYLVSLLGGLTFLMATIIGLAIFVDPYGLYRPHDRLSGLENHTRLIKPAWAAESDAQVVMAGSSRAEFLLDPEIVSQLTGKPSFNIAVSGANIYEVRRNLQHVVAVAPIETMITGLDLFMFNEGRGVRSGFEENRLAVAASGTENASYWLADMAATLSSLDAIDAVRRKLKYQNKDVACQDVWTYAGRRTPNYYACRMAEPEGQQRGVRATLADYLARPTDLYNGFVFDERPLPSNSLANIDALIQLAGEDRKLILYFSALHPLHLKLIEQMGLWETFERWKISLTQKVAQARAEGVDVELWDFALIGPLTDQPVFAATRSEEIQFYDSNHLSWNVRERFLKTLLGADGGESGLGVVLTPEIIDAHLASIRAQRVEWQHTNSEDMAVFVELVSEAGEKAARN